MISLNGTVKRNGSKRRDAGLAEHYAHRGLFSNPDVPENSLAAFRAAVEHGFPSEFDVHQISDGSLVVFHDDDVDRMTGQTGRIADYDTVSLSWLRLAGTEERIPTFNQVLDVYEDTGLPLLIEIKTDGGNFREVTEAVCRRLETYTGKFVLESFDPRVLLVLREIRPDFIRGQLAQNFFRKREGLPLAQAALLTEMAYNVLTRPDFIAYKVSDKDDRKLRLLLDRFHIPGALWVITTPEEYRMAVEMGRVPIFEGFIP